MKRSKSGSATNDHDSLLGLLDEVFSAAEDPANWTKALESIRVCLRASDCRVLTYEPGPIAESKQLSSLDGWSERETYTLDAVAAGGAMVSAIEPRARTSRSSLLATQDPDHTIRGVILHQGPEVTCLELARPGNAGPFDAGEHELVGLLLPCLRTALRVERRVRRAEQQERAAHDTLDLLSIALCRLTADLRVSAANRAAKEVLASHDAVRLDSSGRLVVAGRGREELESLVQMALCARNPEQMRADAVRLESDSGLAALYVLVTLVTLSTLQVAGEKTVAGEEPVATVILFDPDRPTRVDEERLCGLYDLTPAEARLAAMLAQGLPLHRAAEHLGITYETARTHLKRIFSKTRSERQLELVRLILRGPAQIPA